jgi:hypothetical protein
MFGRVFIAAIALLALTNYSSKRYALSMNRAKTHSLVDVTSIQHHVVFVVGADVLKRNT